MGQWDLVETEGCGLVKTKSLFLGIEHFRLGIMFCMVASRRNSSLLFGFFAKPF